MIINRKTKSALRKVLDTHLQCHSITANNNPSGNNFLDFEFVQSWRLMYNSNSNNNNNNPYNNNNNKISNSKQQSNLKREEKEITELNLFSVEDIQTMIVDKDTMVTPWLATEW